MASSSESEDPEMESSFEQLSTFKEESDLDNSGDIDINFDFLDQVSTQLYRNPRRAVEELVCNSYDAGATECEVLYPEGKDEKLYVLDNGSAMDEEELDRLWDIADSPKKALEKNPDKERVQNGRQQIGKFGIGKLAAFAVGNELTHIATKDGRTRVVTVAKEDIEGRDFDNPPKCEIFGMDEEEAREYVEKEILPDNITNPWEEDDEEWESWTLAVVDEIKPSVVEGRTHSHLLKPMIRTAIPLSTDFSVKVNGGDIGEREPASEKISSLLIGDDDEFKDHLESDLREAWVDIDDEIDSTDEVDANRYECEFTEVDAYEEDQDPRPGLQIPKLGPIAGEAAVYEETLTTPKREKKDVQDYGYRITVRGKLVNRGEPNFDTPQKSYKYWSRFLATVEIPELDDAILLQRDSIDESQIEARITREVLDSIFNYLRTKARHQLESEDYDPGTFFKRLSTLSPQKVPEALQGLVDEEGVPFPKGGWDDVDVTFKSGGADSDLAHYEAENHAIVINTDHTLLNALNQDSFPNSSREVVGEALAGQLLAIGYFRHNEVEESLIEGAVEIIENSARSAAKLIQDQPEYYGNRLSTTVQDGDEPFEQAVVDALLNLGLDVDHYGASDKPDAVVTISRPGQNFKIAVEAKGGTSTSADHKEISISTMHEHADDFDCQHCVAVSSREIFQLRGNSETDDSSLIEQVNDHPDVSIMTIEMLREMLRLHQQNPYDYTQLKNIFQLNSPDHDDETQINLKKEITEENKQGDLFEARDGENRPLLEVADLPDLAKAWWRQMPRNEKMVRTILEVAKEQQDRFESEGSRTQKPRVGMIYNQEITEEGIQDQDIEAVLSSASLTGLATLGEDGKYYTIEQSVDEIMEKMDVSTD